MAMWLLLIANRSRFQAPFGTGEGIGEAVQSGSQSAHSSSSPRFAGEEKIDSRSRGAVFRRPSYDQAIPSKLPQNQPSSDQAGGGFSGCVTVGFSSRSPDEAKRNPGTIRKLEYRSRISLRFIRATKNNVF
jgi:hypothetical protein